jgi:NAD(P)-dependent dehydrogenase (short-subunit alcohol dehydrogenase family)
MEQLTGKVAVVTGGASGIGWALAERFGAEGMRVVLADVEAVALDVAAATLAAGGVEVAAVRTDVSDAASVDALARAAVERFGTVHVVCNNAGVGGHGYATWDGPIADWDWVLGVNVYGVVHGIRSFVPILREQDEGHVVNTASLAGLVSIPFMAPYCVSKHAVLAISEALRHELAFAASAVGVSVLCPGFLKSNLMEGDRNWPDRLGPDPGFSDDPAGTFIEQVFRDSVSGGLDPGVLADLTVDAVRTGRFLVTTHPDETRQVTENRLGTVGGAAPTLPALG